MNSTPASGGAEELSLEQSLLEQGNGRLDDYVIEKAIGRGHFSVVHRAVRKSDNRKVALKKVQIFDMMDAKARDRCLKEVKLLQTLEPHPCIIQYLDSFITDNELYIVFEFAEHGDLRRLLRRALECNATLQEPQIWRYFTQVCSGISHMHAARVMHRDIKPANIFLAANGCVKLGDLGLGRAFSDQTYEAVSKVGTPLYMSPEVLDGRGYEWKSDIWSLGCLLYELATLRSPFKGHGDKDNLYTLFKKISVGQFAELPAHYSEHLRSLVGRMIQTDPKLRPDIQETLSAAKAATAYFEKAAADAKSTGAGEGSGGDFPDCTLIMEAVLDKLKILDYEQGFLRPQRMVPLPRGYFTSEGLWPPLEQFVYLFRLTCWLLESGPLREHDLWDKLPARPSEADVASAAVALVEALGTCDGTIAQHARSLVPMKVRSGCGVEVCAMLNLLADAALSATGFMWAKPQHCTEANDEVIEDGDVEEADRVHGDCGRVHGGFRDAEWHVLEDEFGEHCSEGAREARRLLPIAASSIDHVAWRHEYERTKPALKVHISWRQLHWRHRLELLEKRAPEMVEALETVSPGLHRLGEQALREAATFAPLIEKQRQLESEAEQRLSEGAVVQARVDVLSTELSRLYAQIDGTKREVDEISARIGDRRSVDAIVVAARRLRRETDQVSLRCALAQRELERHKMRSLPVSHEGINEEESGGERGSLEALSIDMG